MLHNTNETYGWMSKLFHWGIALVIIGLFLVAYWMESLEPSDTKWSIYGLHKATGIVALALIILRLTWRFTQVQPLFPQDMPRWQQIAAHSNYYLMYVLMIGMPIVGIMMSLLGGHAISFYGLFTLEPLAEKHPLAAIAHQLHTFFSYGLIATVAIHIAATLYHHFIRKDDILKRMI